MPSHKNTKGSNPPQRRPRNPPHHPYPLRRVGVPARPKPFEYWWLPEERAYLQQHTKNTGRNADPEPDLDLISTIPPNMTISEWRIARDAQLAAHKEWKARQGRQQTEAGELDADKDLLISYESPTGPIHTRSKSPAASCIPGEGKGGQQPPTSSSNQSERAASGGGAQSADKTTDTFDHPPSLPPSNAAPPFERPESGYPSLTAGTDTTTGAACAHRLKKRNLPSHLGLLPAIDCDNRNGVCNRLAKVAHFVECPGCRMRFCALCNKKCGMHNRRMPRPGHGREVRWEKKVEKRERRELGRVEGHWSVLVPERREGPAAEVEGVEGVDLLDLEQ